VLAGSGAPGAGAAEADTIASPVQRHRGKLANGHFGHPLGSRAKHTQTSLRGTVRFPVEDRF